MSVCGKAWAAGARLVAASVLFVLCPAGCNRPAPNEETTEAPTAGQADGKPAVVIDPRLRQSFADATRKDPPADWSPPAATRTGKSVGKLFEEVRDSWDKVPLATDAGKLVAYSATLETDLGVIEIDFRADLAPNHVRNFVALARAGYYDGLVFDRAIDQESEPPAVNKVQLIEAGCPVGTGDSPYGSIGYWLKAEVSDKVTHDEGAVGACHGEEQDTAACKFYINLHKAPFLDGSFTVFGKVSKGLDVARKIFRQPMREDEQYPRGDQRPLKPVVIKKVTINSREVDAPATEPTKQP